MAEVGAGIVGLLLFLVDGVGVGDHLLYSSVILFFIFCWKVNSKSSSRTRTSVVRIEIETHEFSVQRYIIVLFQP